MPPLRGYTLGMIRRGLSFPPARPEQSCGRPSRGGDGKGDSAAKRPRPLPAGEQPRDCRGWGRSSVKSSDQERLRRSLGVLPSRRSLWRRRAGPGRLPPPPCPAEAASRNRRAPALSRVSGDMPLGPETKHQVLSVAVGLLETFFVQSERDTRLAFLGEGSIRRRC